MSASFSAMDCSYDTMDDDIPFGHRDSKCSGDSYFDVPAFLRRQSDDSIDRPNEPSDKDEQQTPIKSLAVSRDIRWKLAGRQVHTVEALIAIPSADWDAYFGLNDAEVAELLRALRKSGFRAS
jgi:hypothetical protein